MRKLNCEHVPKVTQLAKDEAGIHTRWFLVSDHVLSICHNSCCSRQPFPTSFYLFIKMVLILQSSASIRLSP